MGINGIGELYNIADIILEKNLKNGRADKTAIYYRKQKISYRELEINANKAGNGLVKLGIEMENRVAILLYDSPEFIASFLGIIKIGAVAIPINTRLHLNDSEYYLNFSRAKALIVNREIWEEIKHIRDRFIYLKHVIIVEKEDDNQNYCDGLNYHCFIDKQESKLEPAKTTKDDQSLWLFTSGTTGRSKAVVHLHHDIEFCANSFAAHVLKLTEEDKIYCSSKLFFAYGLGNSLYYPLFFGASVVLIPERTTAEIVFKTIEEYKPTVFYGVPTLYNSLIRHVRNTNKKYDLSTLRICMSSAEALPVAILHTWQELFGLRILDAIGCTETLHAYISNTCDDFKEESSGKVVPGYEAKIIGQNKEELSAYGIGDLLIKGDSIAAGYFNMHEATKSKFIGEWLVTGDKYYKDSDDFYFYCGRSDEMIKVCGMWVSPYEIETCILKSDYVLEAAVVGGMDKNKLIRPKAYIVLKDEYAPSEQIELDIMRLVEQNLPTYKRLNEIVFMRELPKTATGKIQRFKLRDMTIQKQEIAASCVSY